MRARRLICAFGAMVFGITWGSYAEKQLPNWNELIKRLPPSSFKELPSSILQRVNAKGCTIPQEAFSSPFGPNNVIRGEFATMGQTDWAVLCSKSGKSSIVVFWGRPTACSSELASEDDTNYLQENGQDRMVYSRAIHTLSQTELKGDAGSLGHGQMKHQGIENIFVGKGSTVFYCSTGKWKVIGGAD